MIRFVNFARIASLGVVFHLGTLDGYFFHEDFWPNLNFPLEYQIKRVLNISKFEPQGPVIQYLIDSARDSECSR